MVIAAAAGAGSLRGVVRRLSTYRSVRLMWRALCTSSGQPRGTHTVTSGTLRSAPRLSSGAVAHRMIPTPRDPHTVFWFLHALSLNWLQVLGTAELAQVYQCVCQQLHAIMPLLYTFKSE